MESTVISTFVHSCNSYIHNSNSNLQSTYNPKIANYAQGRLKGINALAAAKL